MAGLTLDADDVDRFEVVLEDGQLALRIPETPMPLGLFPPDEDGVSRLRLDPSVEIRFEEQG